MKALSSWNPGTRAAAVCKQTSLAIATGLLLCASVAACASTQAAYNPDHLGPDQLAQVSTICEKVMGLSPSERLSGGYWMGNDRLDYYTSYYRGCVLSLSDSLQSVSDAQRARQAHESCRAKGLKPDSPDLALCVLQDVNRQPDINTPATQSDSGTRQASTDNLPAASGSLTYAFPHEVNRREELACAALGLEPSHGGFESCVRGLKDTFYAIDHPID